MDEFYFISFESTHHALQAEKYLKDNKFSITVIPTPREVTLSCGLSIKINSGGIDSIKGMIDEGMIRVKGIYFLKKINGMRNIEKLY